MATLLVDSRSPTTPTCYTVSEWSPSNACDMSIPNIYPFAHSPQYAVLVCQLCQFACLAEEVPRHIQQRHEEISFEERRRIAQSVLSIPNLLRNTGDLHLLATPCPEEPIPFLAAPKLDGLKCRKCSYISRHVQNMQDHCRKKHGWQNPRGAGRPASGTGKLPELPWSEDVSCQRFFPSRAGSAWFEVGRKSGKQPRNTRPSIAGIVKSPLLTSKDYAHIKAVMLREGSFQQRENESRNSSKIIGEQSLPSTTLWLERTRWHTTFRDARRDILRALTQLPNRRALGNDLIIGQASEDGNPDIFSPSKVEQKIACILSAMDPVLDRCEKTACNTNRNLLCWLQSRRIGSCTNKEFTLVAEKSSRQWYRTLWKRFLAFVVRVSLLNEQLGHETKMMARDRELAPLEKLWDHRAWDFVDPARGLWPSPAERAQPSTDESIAETDTGENAAANSNNNACVRLNAVLDISDDNGIDTDTDDIEDEDAYS